MYKENRMGPHIDPWGTPQKQTAESEKWFPIELQNFCPLNKNRTIEEHFPECLPIVLIELKEYSDQLCQMLP